jgi:hypothetical protein
MNGVVLDINIASTMVVFQRKYESEIQKDIQNPHPSGFPKFLPVSSLNPFGNLMM